MARRKRSKITSRNLLSRLTRKGTYYIDLSRLDILARMSDKQRQYLRMATRENIVIFLSKEEYHTLTREQRKEHWENIHKILTGEMFKNDLNATLTSYINALNANGLSQLAEGLSKIAENMDYVRKYRLFAEMPPVKDLYTPRNERKRLDIADLVDYDVRHQAALRQAIKVINMYGYELDKETKDFMETFDIKLDEK